MRNKGAQTVGLCLLFLPPSYTKSVSYDHDHDQRIGNVQPNNDFVSLCNAPIYLCC